MSEPFDEIAAPPSGERYRRWVRTVEDVDGSSMRAAVGMALALSDGRDADLDVLLDATDPTDAAYALVTVVSALARQLASRVGLDPRQMLAAVADELAGTELYPG